jgi:cell filamentation protein
MSDPIDEQSKKKAYELYENSILETTEIGTIKGLQQIHAYLFEGLYDFAGKIRTKNISKGGFAFANCLYFHDIFSQIEKMPESNADEIIDKYIETNIAHPFMEGNGRATRIWLDCILKFRSGKCVDWQLIDKKDYLSAMEKSPVDPQPIKELIKGALTDQIDDREIFMKGIDYSYYYETIED